MLDGRRTLADISRAVNNLDRNPTRLLFGASSGTPAAAPAPAGASGICRSAASSPAGSIDTSLSIQGER